MGSIEWFVLGEAFLEVSVDRGCFFKTNASFSSGPHVYISACPVSRRHCGGSQRHVSRVELPVVWVTIWAAHTGLWYRRIPNTILHRQKGAIETRPLCNTIFSGVNHPPSGHSAWVMCSFRENQWRRTCGLQLFSTPAAVRHTPTVYRSLGGRLEFL